MNQNAVLFPVLPAALAILAVGLLVWGRWGKRINDHPTCRKCGYDLTGRPPDSQRCSECGSDLGGKKAIVIGQRRKRTAIVIIALISLILNVGWLGSLGWKTVSNLTAQEKPVWWLMLDTRNKKPATVEAALDELADRWESGKLSAKQADALMDRFLELHLWGPARIRFPADPPVRARWQRPIELAHARGELDDARWRRYWQQIWPFEMKIRPKVRRGDPIPVRVHVGNYAWSRSRSEYPLHLRYTPVSLQIDGIECPVPPNMGRDEYSDPPIFFMIPKPAVLHVPLDVLARLHDGTQKVTMVVDLTIDTRSTGKQSAPVKEIVHTRLNAEGSFDLLPADVPSVKLVTPPNYRASVESAVHVDKLLMEYGQPVKGATAATFIMQLGYTPVRISADVYLRNGRHEWLAGSLGNWNSLLADRSLAFRTRLRVDGFFCDRADVILRPNIQRALETLDVTEIWGEEIILKDVPARLWTDYRRPTTGPK